MKENDLKWEEFSKVDMRIGTITSAEVFENAKKPAYKLLVDFGQLGIRKSSAQITDHYNPDDLIGKQIIAVVNFPPKQIATMISDCLVLGIYGESGVILLAPERAVENGLKIG